MFLVIASGGFDDIVMSHHASKSAATKAAAKVQTGPVSYMPQFNSWYQEVCGQDMDESCNPQSVSVMELRGGVYTRHSFEWIEWPEETNAGPLSSLLREID